MACIVFFFKIFFFGVGHFQSLYWICYNIAYVLCFDFLAERHVWSYLPYQKSNPRSRNRTHAPEIEPMLPALTTGQAGKSPSYL